MARTLLGMIKDILGDIYSNAKMYDSQGKPYNVYENDTYKIVVDGTMNVVVDKLEKNVYRTVSLAHQKIHN